MVIMNDIYLIEDHDEALRIWREKSIKGVDLVHLDAHIDFGFHPARPIEKIINTAGSLKELKMGLEKAIAFMHYEKDFDKQTNIGNYIYPAMQEGIIKDFYWVIPGGIKEFKASTKFIKKIIRDLTGQDLLQKNIRIQRLKRTKLQIKDGLITTQILGRDFIICILERLPVLKQKILLDIDTDFLVIDTLLKADNKKNIGKRKPWILPKDLVKILKKRIKKPQVITIAYSVNGGYTPIRYKHLGDETAFLFAPDKFKRDFKINSSTAQYFNQFCSTNKKEYYRKAVRLNPTYRVADNNYGPLYLSLRKFSLAQKEFLKILRVDPKNPACLLGLGNLALERRDSKRAKKYFSSTLKSTNHRLFTKIKNQGLWGLARAEFNLKNFERAKELLLRYQILEPLQSYSYYLLGYIFEKEKKYPQAATFYKDAIRLGFGGIEPIWRLLKISPYLKEKGDIIKYVIAKYKEFKRGFTRIKRISLKKGRKVKGLYRVERKMAIIEKMSNEAITYGTK